MRAFTVVGPCSGSHHQFTLVGRDDRSFESAVVQITAVTEKLTLLPRMAGAVRLVRTPPQGHNYVASTMGLIEHGSLFVVLCFMGTAYWRFVVYRF